jgi:hypothetical protein
MLWKRHFLQNSHYFERNLSGGLEDPIQEISREINLDCFTQKSLLHLK